MDVRLPVKHQKFQKLNSSLKNRGRGPQVDVAEGASLLTNETITGLLRLLISYLSCLSYLFLSKTRAADASGRPRHKLTPPVFLSGWIGAFLQNKFWMICVFRIWILQCTICIL